MKKYNTENALFSCESIKVTVIAMLLRSIKGAGCCSYCSCIGRQRSCFGRL